MNGYLIQNGKGLYLTKRLDWYEHDDPLCARVHPAGSLDWICKELKKIRATLIPGQVWSRPAIMTPATWTPEEGVVVTGKAEEFPWSEDEGNDPGVGTVFHEGYSVSFVIQEENGECLKSNLTWIPCEDLLHAFQHPQYVLHYLTMVADAWATKPSRVRVVLNGKILDKPILFNFNFDEMAKEVDALIRA